MVEDTLKAVAPLDMLKSTYHFRKMKISEVPRNERIRAAVNRNEFAILATNKEAKTGWIEGQSAKLKTEIGVLDNATLWARHQSGMGIQRSLYLLTPMRTSQKKQKAIERLFLLHSEAQTIEMSRGWGGEEGPVRTLQ